MEGTKVRIIELILVMLIVSHYKSPEKADRTKHLRAHGVLQLDAE
jgi:hypothetical protein